VFIQLNVVYDFRGDVVGNNCFDEIETLQTITALKVNCYVIVTLQESEYNVMVDLKLSDNFVRVVLNSTMLVFAQNSCSKYNVTRRPVQTVQANVTSVYIGCIVLQQLKLCLSKFCGWETKGNTLRQMLLWLLDWLRDRLSATECKPAVLPGIV
jgi:hypothetical protein